MKVRDLASTSRGVSPPGGPILPSATSARQPATSSWQIQPTLGTFGLGWRLFCGLLGGSYHRRLDACLRLGLGQLSLECLGGRRIGDIYDQGLQVKLDRGTRGKLEVAGENLGTRRQALDGDNDLLWDVSGLGLDGNAVVVNH